MSSLQLRRKSMFSRLQYFDHRTTKTKSLTEDVLVVFERACQEEDWQVAQHLLEAIETIARREDAEEDLDHVYAQLAQSLHGKPQH
jgi:hypothetical protein